MPKTKLKLASSKVDALKAVAELNDVRVNKIMNLGEHAFAEISYRQPSQLFDMGSMLNVTGVTEAVTVQTKEEKTADKTEPKK